jgi:hypothetical protein
MALTLAEPRGYLGESQQLTRAVGATLAMGSHW